MTLRKAGDELLSGGQAGASLSRTGCFGTIWLPHTGMRSGTGRAYHIVHHVAISRPDHVAQETEPKIKTIAV